MLDDFVGNALCLDDLPVHVGDVQCPIRRIGHVHRAEPGVLRREELDPLFVCGPLSAGLRS